MGGIGSGINSGGFREGSGRKPGSRNKKSLQLIEQAERDDLLTPIGFLLDVMRDSRQALHDRMMAANICMPYMHARLVPQPVAIVDPSRMSDAALLESIRHLERLNAEAEASQAPPNDQPGAVIRHEDWQPAPPVLPLLRPGSQLEPSPSEPAGRRLKYDPVGKRLVQVTQ
jgi:hypothetical protein